MKISSFQLKTLKLKQTVFGVFSLTLLVYMFLPGPTSINQFPALPNSIKSTLEGDTIQVPNTAAYFSNNYRELSTNFYRNIYQENTFLPFSAIKLNYPPEFAYTAIKDQTHSTYLEEYIYPLRDSLFINGLEPFYPDGMKRYYGATKFDADDGKLYETKVNIRFYPSSFFAKIFTWLGICLSIYFLWRMGKKILINA